MEMWRRMDGVVGHFFFFFKQKTAYEIYQCDWSSDVCSSDLKNLHIVREGTLLAHPSDAPGNRTGRFSMPGMRTKRVIENA